MTHPVEQAGFDDYLRLLHRAFPVWRGRGRHPFTPDKGFAAGGGPALAPTAQVAGVILVQDGHRLLVELQCTNAGV